MGATRQHSRCNGSNRLLCLALLNYEIAAPVFGNSG